ncbi:unnamed protein product [Lymnaea stagnalis]|uniref:G-protein coupled receptors family 1 profile domain-containing protein n=1 Tax=Lymnaea stagnalis TaxID=6523 RepID=A0AAV2HLP7_LYMST
MCKIYYFTESFSICVSVLLLAVIAMERYIAVMHPLKARGLFTTCRMHIAQVQVQFV